MRGTIEDVNQRGYWLNPETNRPNVNEQGQQREVLLVDRDGKPILVREPRPVGFRPDRR
jgi:hypothetical protein